MTRTLIASCLARRPLVLIAFAAFLGVGVAAFFSLNIEAYPDPSFKPSARWVRLLGFELETPFKPFFFPDGRGAAEWVRYNGLRN